MILSLLLTVFASPLAAPQQPTSAVDYFPADTLAVLEFSLEPWDRSRKKTIAHGILSDLRVLRTFVDHAQEQLEITGEGVDLRKILGRSRLYLGFVGKSLPTGSILLGIDTLPGLGQADLSVVLDKSEVPYIRVGTSILAILPLDSMAPFPKEPSRLALENLLTHAAAAADGNPAADEGPRTLSQQPSWIELHQKLQVQTPMAALWIPSEAWSEGQFQYMLGGLIGEELPPQALDFISTIMGAMGLEGIRGGAWTMEVSPPYIVDKAVVIGTGTMMEFYQPYSDQASEIWERLADCDGNAVSVSVAGTNYENLGQWAWDFMEVIFTEIDMSETEEVMDIKEKIRPLFDLLGSLGPEFVTEMSLEQLNDMGQARITVSVADVAKCKEILGQLAPDIMAGIQIGLAQSSGQFSAEWGDQSAIFNAHASLDGKTRLGDNPTFKEVLPVMKQMAGGASPVWVTYWAPALDATVLVNSAETWRTVAEMFGFPLLVDSSKLGTVPELEAKIHPSISVSTRQGEVLFMESRSTFGLGLSSILMGLKSYSTQMSRLEISELNEEEF